MRVGHLTGGRALGLRHTIHQTNSYSVALAALTPRLPEAREILVREDPDVAARVAAVNRVWA